jgi:hypothetical protein
VVVHIRNTSTFEAETEGSRIKGQPGPHSKTLSPKSRKRKSEREGRMEGGREKTKEIKKDPKCEIPK